MNDTKEERLHQRRRQYKLDYKLFLILFCLCSRNLSTCTAFILRPHCGHFGFCRRQTTARIKSRRRSLAGRDSTKDSTESVPSAREVSRQEANISSTTKYRIQPEQLEQLKASIDIVSVIESFNLPRFQRSGEARATSLCPFHDDRNPSLSIDGTRRMYRCFACGAAGDVFQFVREYNKIKKGEELSYYQAVRLVNEQFTDGSPLPLGLGDSSSQSLTDDQIRALAHQKDRIMLANAVAAAFYTNCLISPSGGAARSYLAQRGLTAGTVRAFAIGYAPDAYYRSNVVTPDFNQPWGNGGLVEHLRQNDFSPQEILDAGLAIRTKRSGPTKPRSVKNATNATTEDNVDYRSLMDRFRGRVVVPIFDASGKKVLGFGGRILTEDGGGGKFVAPKYLNSPESAVFHKKTVLFGQHLAKQALEESFRLTQDHKKAVVLVEGYMDAIALWQAGVQAVVASMGTSLSLEQLTAAAKIAGSRAGSLVLCLDNDDAGVAALERVCSSGFLSSVSPRWVAEISIATLPENRKDPAEFTEMHKSPKKVAEDFRRTVVDTSVEWTDWFLDRIMGRYDASAKRGAAGCFGDVFERVANFLATFQNAADRIERASLVAASLVDIMSKGDHGSTASNAVRIQLESDLIDMVSRLAKSKEAISQRIESVDVGSDAGLRTKLLNVAKGGGISGTDGTEKLSTKAIRANQISKTGQERGRPRSLSRTVSPRKSPDEITEQGKRVPRGRAYKPPKQMVERDLIPHHQGLQFKHPSDRAWIRDVRENKRRKRELHLGTYSETGAINELGQKEIVWFNSNRFLGKEFLTQEAWSAGYSNNDPVRDRGFLEKGIGALIELDPDFMSASAEDALLRNLILFGGARRALKELIDASDTAGSRGQVEWSVPEKAWLFSHLVQKGGDIPNELTGPDHAYDVRSHLAKLPDAPAGAFAVVSLDKFPLINGNADDGGQVSPRDMVGKNGNPSIHAAAVVNFQDMSRGIEMEEWTAAGSAPGQEPGLSDGLSGPLGSSEYQNTVLTQETRREQAEAQEEMVIDVKVESSRIGAAPPFALGTTLGTLDRLFTQDFLGSLYDNSATSNEKAELAVQDLYATLLWTSSLRRLAKLRRSLLEVSGQLQNLDENDGQNKPSVDQASATLATNEGILSRDNLLGSCANLTLQVRDAAETAEFLGSSARRISKRLIDTMSLSSDYRISKDEYDKLCESLDVHMSVLSEYPKYFPVNEADVGEFYEDTLDRAYQDWGELFQDNYLWSPKDVRESVARFEDETADYIVSDDEESLEEFHERVDREWEDWEEPIATADFSDSSSGLDIGSGGNHP